MFGRFSNIFMLRSVLQFLCHSQKSSHVLELGVALSEFTLTVYNTCQVSDELLILLFSSYVYTFKVMFKKALKNCQSFKWVWHVPNLLFFFRLYIKIYDKIVINLCFGNFRIFSNKVYE